MKESKEILKKLDKSQSGIAGEFCAAGELARRGFNVSLTFGNTKAIDLLVEKDGKNLAVQVKAIQSVRSVGWSIPYTKINQEMYYVLVQLNADKLDYSPEFFPISGMLLKQLIKKVNSGRDYIDYNPLKKLNLQSNWDIFKYDYSSGPVSKLESLKLFKKELENLSDKEMMVDFRMRLSSLFDFTNQTYSFNDRELPLLLINEKVDYSILSLNVLKHLLLFIAKRDYSTDNFLLKRVSTEIVIEIISQIEIKDVQMDPV